VKLYCSSRRDLKNLSPQKGQNAYDEEFALDRCLSRIVEMQSKKYLEEDSYWQMNQKGTLKSKPFDFD